MRGHGFQFCETMLKVLRNVPGNNGVSSYTKVQKDAGYYETRALSLFVRSFCHLSLCLFALTQVLNCIWTTITSRDIWVHT